MLRNNTMDGFTRTVYNDGYKYTMVYPPDWKYGDPRQPEVHKEHCVPGPSDPRVAENNYFVPRAYPEHFKLTGWQPYSTAPAARPRQPVGTHTSDQGSSEELQCAHKKARTHPLKTYLAQAWMPQYVIDPQIDPLAPCEWPFLQELVRVPRTRKLYLVQRIFDWDLRRAFNSLKQGLTDVQLTHALAEQGKLVGLTLPDAVCCDLDEHDEQFIDGCPIGDSSDVVKLVQSYPLRTVMKIIRLFLCVPDDHEVCARLQFEDVNHLCPVRNSGLFELLAMPGPKPDELSLLVVVATSWEIKYVDLEEFARVGVPDGDLDYPMPINAPPFPADTLWAVIWDMCLKHNCRYFVLTTYDEWVFGTLSPDMHRARVTTHLRAPVFPRDMHVSAKDVAQPYLPVPNVFELLFLWIFAAGDDEHIWWPLPPNMPDPVKPSDLSILDGGWIGLETGV